MMTRLLSGETERREDLAVAEFVANREGYVRDSDADK